MITETDIKMIKRELDNSTIDYPIVADIMKIILKVKKEGENNG